MGRRKSNIWNHYVRVTDSHYKCTKCHFGLYPNSTKMMAHFKKCKRINSDPSQSDQEEPIQEIDIADIIPDESISQMSSRLVKNHLIILLHD